MHIKYSIGSGSLVKPDGFNNIFQKKMHEKPCYGNRGGVDFFFYYLSDRVGICGCESREEISPNRAPFNISLSGKPLKMQIC